MEAPRPTTERWKRVNRYPYEVSDRGRVRNVRTGRVLRPYVLWDRPGHRYACVMLYRMARADGRSGPLVRVRRQHYVHRLVALYHVPGRSRACCQVDHINRQTTDSRADNLQWVTPIENLRRRHPDIYPACYDAATPSVFEDAF